jgi:hypothetical protein
MVDLVNVGGGHILYVLFGTAAEGEGVSLPFGRLPSRHASRASCYTSLYQPTLDEGCRDRKKSEGQEMSERLRSARSLTFGVPVSGNPLAGLQAELLSKQGRSDGSMLPYFESSVLDSVP